MYKLTLLFLILTGFTVHAQIAERWLHEGWTFECEDSLAIRGKAKIPGSVYLDLQKANFIKNPFFGDEELTLGWVAERNWIYRCKFRLTPEERVNPDLKLRFESIDTYAEIRLNGELILTTSNQFRVWEAAIARFLRKEPEQVLEIRLLANLKKARELSQASALQLPGGEAPWIRKVQHHFGWDWSPRLPAGGITGSIKLVRKEVQEPASIQVETVALNGDTARLSLRLHFIHPVKQTHPINWKIKGIPQLFKGKISAGSTDIQFPFVLVKVKRWWSHDLGNPYLYDLEVLNQSGTQPYKKAIRFGIRTISLEQNPDKWGKSFNFNLNNRPLFAKGANVVPLHVFLPEIKQEHYRKLVLQAKAAGFNMIRIWGGGTYGSDALYDLCDEEGILVWQDFMFACALYPSDSSFLNNVKEEVKQQVLRLRHHPSLVLWCGNNEIDEAWHNWGWQKQYNYSTTDSAQLWQGYRRLFHELIPSVLSELDPGRAYHPSSPTTGWGRKESLEQGDLHYWGVWWGMEPLRKYREKTGRFVSEYGFQSMPATSSLLPWLPENPLSGDSSAFKNHQKHPFGFKAIQKALDEELPPAKNPNDYSEYVYRTQVVQAKALEIATQAHLLAYPRCMGSLLWQLNDCWPVASWSILDHLYRPKPAFATLQKAFQPIRLLVDSFPQDSLEAGPSPGKPDGLLRVYLINTGATDVSGQVRIDWMDFQGNVLNSNLLTAKAAAGEKQFIGAFPRPVDSMSTSSCWVLRLIPEKGIKIPERVLYFFKPDKDLRLPQAVFTTRRLIGDDALELEAGLSFIRNLWVDEETAPGAPFYDLLPKEKVTIKLPKGSNNLKFKIWYTNPE